MNNSCKRSSKASAPGLAPMPSIPDDELVRRVLTLDLGSKFRAELERTAANIEPGKYGQLERSERDALLKFAREHGVLEIQKKKKVALTALSHVDTYDVRETGGTEFGAMIVASQVPSLGGKMPAPPGRRSA
jgi:hypothetical protein